MIDFNFSIPTKVLFGAGKLDELKREPLPGHFALVVVSGGDTVKNLGYPERVLAALKHQGIEYLVFDKVHPNPSKAAVMEAAQIARDNFCDFVVGIGGASVIDTAKGAALMARNPGDLWDYIVTGSGKGKKVKNKALPLVAVMTTSGSGTEVNPWMDITFKAIYEHYSGHGWFDTAVAGNARDWGKYKDLSVNIPKQQGGMPTSDYNAWIGNPETILPASIRNKAVQVGEEISAGVEEGMKNQASKSIGENTMSQKSVISFLAVIGLKATPLGSCIQPFAVRIQ